MPFGASSSLSSNQQQSQYANNDEHILHLSSVATLHRHLNEMHGITEDHTPQQILAIGAMVDTLVNGESCGSALATCHHWQDNEQDDMYYDDDWHSIDDVQSKDYINDHDHENDDMSSVPNSSREELAPFSKSLSWDDETLDTIPASPSEPFNNRKQMKMKTKNSSSSSSSIDNIGINGIKTDVNATKTEGNDGTGTHGINDIHEQYEDDSTYGGYQDPNQNPPQSPRTRRSSLWPYCTPPSTLYKDVTESCMNTGTTPQEISFRTDRTGLFDDLLLARPTAKSRQSLARLGESSPQMEQTNVAIWSETLWKNKDLFDMADEKKEDNDVHPKRLDNNAAAVAVAADGVATSSKQKRGLMEQWIAYATSEGVSQDPSTNVALTDDDDDVSGSITLNAAVANEADANAAARIPSTATTSSHGQDMTTTTTLAEAAMAQPCRTMEDNPIEYQIGDYQHQSMDRRQDFADSKHVIRPENEDDGFVDTTIQNDDSNTVLSSSGIEQSLKGMDKKSASSPGAEKPSQNGVLNGPKVDMPTLAEMSAVEVMEEGAIIVKELINDSVNLSTSHFLEGRSMEKDDGLANVNADIAGVMTLEPNGESRPQNEKTKMSKVAAQGVESIAVPIPMTRGSSRSPMSDVGHHDKDSAEVKEASPAIVTPVKKDEPDKKADITHEITMDSSQSSDDVDDEDLDGIEVAEDSFLEQVRLEKEDSDSQLDRIAIVRSPLDDSDTDQSFEITLQSMTEKSEESDEQNKDLPLVNRKEPTEEQSCPLMRVKTEKVVTAKPKKIPFIRGMRKRLQRLKLNKSSNQRSFGDCKEVLPMTGFYTAGIVTGEVSASSTSRDGTSSSTSPQEENERNGQKVPHSNASCAISTATGGTGVTVLASNVTKFLE